MQVMRGDPPERRATWAPSVTRSVVPETATAPPVKRAHATAARSAASTESVLSTPRGPSPEASSAASFPSPHSSATAMISEALPRRIAGGFSRAASMSWVRRLPMPMPTGSSTQGLPAPAQARAVAGTVCS